jgi:hypothetical protein
MYNHFRKLAFLTLAISAALLSLVDTVTAQLTFSAGFEPPTYSPGFIGGGNYPGQDNWYGFGYQFVTNSLAHSGSQSLITTSGGSVTKNFNTPDLTMSINKGIDWYMQTWAFVLPGAGSDGASFAAASSLGSAF